LANSFLLASSMTALGATSSTPFTWMHSQSDARVNNSA
jgi:hypothetical protein